MTATLYTIGHSTRTIESLLEVLADSGIEALVDIRALPRSRRQPQFNRDALEDALASQGVRYSWHGMALGGFRKPRPDTRHVALRIPAFRGFADHMESEAFRCSLDEVLRAAERERLAIMCAERDPDQCHRSLITDAALLRGAQVIHLIDRGESRAAHRSAIARAVGATLVYDAGQSRLLDDA
ncbi:MAG: DUF488 domain-containing protein [Burkholderiales bacterium]